MILEKLSNKVCTKSIYRPTWQLEMYMTDWQCWEHGSGVRGECRRRRGGEKWRVEENMRE